MAATFSVTIDHGLQGTVTAIVDVEPPAEELKRLQKANCMIFRSEVHLKDVVIPAPNFWSDVIDKTYAKGVISCWQKVNQLNVDLGDAVVCSNCDEMMGAHQSGARWWENGSTGKFQVVDAKELRKANEERLRKLSAPPPEPKKLTRPCKYKVGQIITHRDGEYEWTGVVKRVRQVLDDWDEKNKKWRYVLDVRWVDEDGRASSHPYYADDENLGPGDAIVKACEKALAAARKELELAKAQVDVPVKDGEFRDRP